MRCRRPFLAALWGCLALAVALSMGGCTLVDSSLSPRAFDINQGTQNARESGILLNIVRASRSEPLNFVALSRYTGTGSLGVNAGGSQNDLLRFGTPTSVATKGIFTSAVNVNAGNAFDVGTLENRDFYGGFLSPLDLEGLNLLLNAGLSREVVFHSVMQAFRVTHTNGTAYLFENNPSDDSWQGAPRSPECAKLYDGRESAFEPVFLTPIWQRGHERRLPLPEVPVLHAPRHSLWRDGRGDPVAAARHQRQRQSPRQSRHGSNERPIATGPDRRPSTSSAMTQPSRTKTDYPSRRTTTQRAAPSGRSSGARTISSSDLISSDRSRASRRSSGRPMRCSSSTASCSQRIRSAASA